MSKKDRLEKLKRELIEFDTLTEEGKKLFDEKAAEIKKLLGDKKDDFFYSDTENLNLNSQYVKLASHERENIEGYIYNANFGNVNF